MIGYSDANFAGCKDTKRSTSGYIFMLANGPISWKSHKQSLTASSTMDVEFIACYEATCLAIWLNSFIFGVHVDSISKPLAVYCDNNAAVRFSNNNKTLGGSKHTDIKYLVVKERVLNQTISITHIGATLMFADPLTKGLPPKLFKEYIACMGLVENLLCLD